VDEVYGEIEAPGAGDPADWRHPWIVSVLGEVGVAYLGPNMMRLSEGMLAVFEEAGFSLEEADQGVETVVAYVIGMSTGEAAWLTMLTRSGQSEQEWMERLWPAAEQAVQAHPRLRRLYAAQRGQDSGGTRNDHFDNGLECVLDGLETRLGRTGGSAG
jgi:hypothetical protein